MIEQILWVMLALMAVIAYAVADIAIILHRYTGKAQKPDGACSCKQTTPVSHNGKQSAVIPKGNVIHITDERENDVARGLHQ